MAAKKIKLVISPIIPNFKTNEIYRPAQKCNYEQILRIVSEDLFKRKTNQESDNQMTMKS